MDHVKRVGFGSAGVFRWILVALAMMVSAPLVAASEDAERLARDREFDRWFVVMMLDQKVGWARTSREVDADGHLVSSEVMEMSMGRFGQDIKIGVTSRFVETLDGEAVSSLSVMELGATPTRREYEFVDGGERVFEIERHPDGSERRRREVEAPKGSWLTPGEVSRFVAKRLEAEAESISYATLDTTDGLAVHLVKSTVLERTEVEAIGKVVPAVKLETWTSVAPGLRMISYVSEDGEDIRSSVKMGAIEMEFIATERELALAPFDAPDVMAATLITPNGDVATPRSSRRAAYRLRSVGDGSSLPAFINSGGQRVTRLGDGEVVVRVDLDEPIRMDAESKAALDPRYRGRSRMLDIEDPMLIELTDEALDGLGAGATPAQKAERLRRFVRDHIEEKTLGVGFASASETCRTGEGDCSEHATLLAAMLRIAGIPARVVSGLVYVDQFGGEQRVFGFHMWTQALLPAGEDEWMWVDLDAALSDRYPTDAARIAIATSSLADDDTVNSMVDIAMLMGALRLDVLDPDEAGGGRGED